MVPEDYSDSWAGERDEWRPVQYGRVAMTSQTIAALGLLVAVQLLVLRTSQHAVPSLYFTTSSLFDRRADVSGGAVLFRLSLPFGSGMLAALLAPTDEALVACIAGALCWFLVIWPIIWNPRLVTHPIHRPFIGVLAAFWAAFTVLPLAGVGVAILIEDVLQGQASELSAQYVWAVITAVPIGVAVKLTTRFASQRLSFVDDPQEVTGPDPNSIADEEFAPLGWRSGLLLGVASSAGIALLVRLVRQRTE